VLWASEEKAAELGLRPRARILHHTLVGSDPYYLLDGPVDATQKLLDRTGGELAFISMCCGGSLATTTVLQRI